MHAIPQMFVIPALLLLASCQRPADTTPTPTITTPPTPRAQPPATPAPEPRASPPPAPLPAPAVPEPGFTAPATKAGKRGLSKYIDAPKYDANNVADLAPGGGSPEAAVVHYLASRVRHDERYREVITASCSRDCKYGLAEHDMWKFRGFRLVSRKQTAPGKFWIEVWFEIKHRGGIDTGTDEFTVVAEADGYRIVEVPT